MQQDNKHQYIQEDEIDLRELFKTIWDKKFFIVVFTLLVTIIAIAYVFFKNPIPIYQGKVLFEIGEVQSESFGSSFLDDPNNLSEIIKVKLNVDSELPKKSNNLLELSVSHKNKVEIKKQLETAIEFILLRHKEKVKFYKNYIMSKQIGNINISNSQINKPKKRLIVTVSFVTGFILSIFIVFFMQFIQDFKKDA